jgi:hypothetical protein
MFLDLGQLGKEVFVTESVRKTYNGGKRNGFSSGVEEGKRATAASRKAGNF